MNGVNKPMKITEIQFEEFKSLYEEAVEQGKETFIFMERVVLTQYAKYVIQAIEQGVLR